MRFKNTIVLTLFGVILLLSGCMYPGDEDGASTVPYDDQIEIIQKAVNTYQEQNEGLLPIKTREHETDIYIKYPIEFSRIVPELTEKIPSNAYEKGGIFQYVLIDVETNPTVKLVDLRTAERIRDLNLRKNMAGGKVPFNDAVGEGVYEVNFKELGFDDPVTIPSPYSDAHLPFVVGGDGHFYVDYSLELHRILMEEKPEVEQGEDIRYLLEEDSSVLPAYSLPYTVNEQNEPVFMRRK